MSRILYEQFSTSKAKTRSMSWTQHGLLWRLLSQSNKPRPGIIVSCNEDVKLTNIWRTKSALREMLTPRPLCEDREGESEISGRLWHRFYAEEPISPIQDVKRLFVIQLRNRYSLRLCNLIFCLLFLRTNFLDLLCGSRSHQVDSFKSDPELWQRDVPNRFTVTYHNKPKYEYTTS